MSFKVDLTSKIRQKMSNGDIIPHFPEKYRAIARQITVHNTISERKQSLFKNKK